MKPILLVGLPRSGSTWIAEVLGRTIGTTLVPEPDDPYSRPRALRAKVGLGDYPTAPAAASSRPFRRLWETVMRSPEKFCDTRNDLTARFLSRVPSSLVHAMLGSGVRATGRPALADPVPPPAHSRTLLIKSVSLALCAPVVAEWLDATVVVILRDPRKVAASWARMGDFRAEPLHDDPWVRKELVARHGLEIPNLATAPRRLAWTIGLLDLGLRESARRHSWQTVDHERLSAAPTACFRGLAERLNLSPSAAMSDFIVQMQRPGSGYQVSRSPEQLKTDWRTAFGHTGWRDVEDILRQTGSLEGQPATDETAMPARRARSRM